MSDLTVTGMSGDERFRFDHGVVDVLRLVTEDTCDGVHPETRQVCELVITRAITSPRTAPNGSAMTES